MNFFARWPKSLLATVSISAGIFFIVLLDPPHKVCDSQSALFKDRTQGLLFVIGSQIKLSGKNASSRISKARKICKAEKKLGSCYDYFLRVNYFLDEFDAVSNECQSEVFKIKEVRQTVFQAIKLMSELAWGKKPPRSPAIKSGWLGPSDITFFCKLKNIAQVHDKEGWKTVTSQLFKTLPEVSKMNRDKAWPRMLLSVTCYK